MHSTLYTKRFDTAAYAEVSEDILLPDYLPEVRRVVGVQSSVTADGKYLTGDGVEADGSVTCTVLYTAPDGSLAQVSETMSYTGQIPLKTGENGDRFGADDIVLAASAENVTCRVTSPHKLTLSAKVRVTAISQKAQDASLRCADSGAEQFTVRRKVKDVPTAFMAQVRQSGEVSGELHEREGMKLICASGSICVNDVRTENGKAGQVHVKGDAYITALLRSPEGAYVVSRSRAPLEEQIPLPDSCAQDGTVLPAAFGSVVLIEMEGEGGYAWRMEYDIDCVMICSRQAQITTDAYLAGTMDVSSLDTFRCLSPAAAVNGRLTTSASVHLRPDCSFVYAWGSASADKAEVTEGGVLTLNGAVKLSVVTVGGGEFFLDEVLIPLRYTCGAAEDALLGEAGGRMQMDVTEITARPDGDKLNLSAELAIAAALLTEENRTAVVTLAPEENAKLPQCDGRIRIYVPDSGETDWDVEKRFRLGTDAVRQGNAYVIG